MNAAESGPGSRSRAGPLPRSAFNLVTPAMSCVFAFLETSPRDSFTDLRMTLGPSPRLFERTLPQSDLVAAL